MVLPSFIQTEEINEIDSLGGIMVIRKPTDSFGDTLRAVLNFKLN